MKVPAIDERHTKQEAQSALERTRWPIEPLIADHKIALFAAATDESPFGIECFEELLHLGTDSLPQRAARRLEHRPARAMQHRSHHKQCAAAGHQILRIQARAALSHQRACAQLLTRGQAHRVQRVDPVVH